MKKTVLSSLVLVALTIAVFSSAHSFGLAPCDDYLYVACRDEVTNGLTLAGLRFAFTDVSQSIWMPLSYLSYMLDHSLGWGYGGMHVQSILWHAAGAVVLFLVLLRLFGDRMVAFLAALVWAIHPLRVESVVWIASRKDVISTFFLLLALFFWLKAGKDDLRWLACSVAFLGIGAMAKPSVMVFPAFALAIDFLVTGNRKDTRVYWVIVCLSFLIAAEASLCQRVGGACAFAGLIPLWYRLLNAVAALTVYLGNVLWPDALAMQCMIRYPNLPRFSVLGAGAFALSGVWLVWVVVPRLRRALVGRDSAELWRGGWTENAVIAGLAIFFGCLIPFLGVFGFGVHAFADRFTILPALGLSLGLTALMVRFRLRGAFVAVMAIFCMGLGMKTVRQTDLWRDNIALLTNTLRVDRGDNPNIHRILAVCYWNHERNMEKVYFHLKKAYDLAWCDFVRESVAVSAHFLIDACYATGRAPEAEDFYYWFRKVSYGQNGEDASPELLYADALWLLHSSQPNRIQQAEDVLSRIKRFTTAEYLAATLNYLIAKELGDEKRCHDALVQCAQIPDNGSCCSCQWAMKFLDMDGNISR